MRIANTRKINEQLGKCLNRMELNRLLGIAVTNPVNEEIVFRDEDDLYLRTNAFQASMAKGGIRYDREEALIAVMVCEVASRALGTPPAKLPLPPEILQAIVEESRVFHEGAFEDDPYLKTISLPREKRGRFELTRGSYARYELMHYTVPKRLGAGIMIPRIGTFDHKFRYPRIKEGGTTWMSITPNEILTMKEPIGKARGKVLTLGLGMGYFAFMASEKENVETVTIVEREKDVIDLFETCILPQFPHGEKIRIVQADAFDFANTLADGEYDYCFADLWKGVGDCVTYLRIKMAMNRFEKMEKAFWIEDAMASYLESFVLLLFLEAMGEGKNADGVNGELMVVLRRIFEDAEITRSDQIEELLRPEGLIHYLESM